MTKAERGAASILIADVEGLDAGAVDTKSIEIDTKGILFRIEGYACIELLRLVSGIEMFPNCCGLNVPNGFANDDDEPKEYFNLFKIWIKYVHFDQRPVIALSSRQKKTINALIGSGRFVQLMPRFKHTTGNYIYLLSTKK